ncbi:hypothetical protein P885DRAFT_71887 [Corynascus similis CBS 632.67]
MHRKGCKKSLQGGLNRVFGRHKVSPAPSRRPSTSIADTMAVQAITEGTKQAKASPTASHVSPLALPAEFQIRESFTSESKGQHPPALSISQTLWNAAYDSLEEDADTAELVKSYLKTLMIALDTDPSTDLSVRVKDPIQRQTHMRELVEKGQAKISTPSKITQGVGDVAQFILSAKFIIDAAIHNIPQAALPWAGVCVGLHILLNPAKATRSNLTGIVHVVSRMDWYCALSEHLLKKDQTDESYGSIPPQLKGRAFEFLRALANWDDWDGYLEAVIYAEKCVLDDWGQFDKIKARNLQRELNKRTKRIEELLETIGQDIQTFIALQKEMRRDDEDAECLRHLFVWIFDTREYAAFTNWCDDESSLPSWKTMLLMGIIRELSSKSAKLAPYVSHFFCQGMNNALNSATATLRSLIWLLLDQQPHLISYLRSKHRNAGPSLFQGDSAFIALSSAFESMLKDPNLSPIYFVIDALDECEQGLVDLVKLIKSSLALSDKVKWLVSSRPTVELKTPYTADALLELDAQKLKGPVNAYIDHKLSILKTREGYDGSVLARVAAEVHQRTENTFLWVALVFKELDIEDGSLNHVHGTYALEIVREIPSGLSKLYDYMMARIEKGMRRDPQYCKAVLAVTTLALCPLSVSELVVLAGLPPNMDPRTIVRKCGSFLTTKEETISLIHQSAKDYLDENYTSRLQLAGVAQGHADISRRSITAMSSILQKNIYNLDFGFEAKNISPPAPDPLAPIRYSCVFWADHLLSRGSHEYKKALADDGEVHFFIKEHFLHWLESLSLLGKLSKGLLSIGRLLKSVQITEMRTGRRSRGITTLASASQDHIVRLWNAVTGTQRQTIKGHGGSVNTVAFSPDGKTLASASHDCRVRLWDVTTGAYRQILEGHRDSVNAVSFSLDGKTLASASQDRTVRLWDAATGAHRQTLEGHRGSVDVLAFSLDGKTLVSASNDRTVRLWDVATGVYRQTLEGHQDWINAVAFSPDGETPTSASDDLTVRLWDSAAGSYGLMLQRLRGRVDSYDSSEDNRALKINYRMVRLLSSTSTISPNKRFPGHTLHVHGEWITLSGKKVLWLPSDYRATSVAQYEHMVVLGHRSGKLTFLQFKRW